jgi:hypothetical protein
LTLGLLVDLMDNLNAEASLLSLFVLNAGILLILVNIILYVEHIVIFNAVLQDLNGDIWGVSFFMAQWIVNDEILYILGEG